MHRAVGSSNVGLTRAHNRRYDRYKEITKMKRIFLFLMLALLACVPEAFAAIGGTASSFQISRQLACDDAKHKASMDADSNRNTETFGKKVKSASTTISECRCDGATNRFTCSVNWSLSISYED